MQKPGFNFFNEVEKVELAEDLFGTNVPLDMAFDNPREIVDYLALQLKGWGPNPVAADFLKQLASKRNSPALAQGLHDVWRREQISAVIQEVFSTGDLSAGEDDDPAIPVRKPRSQNLAVGLLLRVLMSTIHRTVVDVIVRRETRWTPPDATPAPESGSLHPVAIEVGRISLRRQGSASSA
jgi:hypothetical protein